MSSSSLIDSSFCLPACLCIRRCTNKQIVDDLKTSHLDGFRREKWDRARKAKRKNEKNLELDADELSRSANGNLWSKFTFLKYFFFFARDASRQAESILDLITNDRVKCNENLNHLNMRKSERAASGKIKQYYFCATFIRILLLLAFAIIVIEMENFSSPRWLSFVHPAKTRINSLPSFTHFQPNERWFQLEITDFYCRGRVNLSARKPSSWAPTFTWLSPSNCSLNYLFCDKKEQTIKN